MSFQDTTPPPPLVSERAIVSHKSDRRALIAISIVGFIFFLGVFAFLPNTGPIFKIYNIPSSSMAPTLPLGHYALVSRAAYGYSRYSFDMISLPISGRFPMFELPQRGDVVTFRLPRDLYVEYVKRIVGLPGDKVQMINGRLVINGQMIEREPVAKVETTGTNGRLSQVPTYRESLREGESHEIIEIMGDTGFLDNTPLFDVPQDQYFVLGDNRDNSTDSRTPAAQGGVGFVPLENIIGRMVFKF